MNDKILTIDGASGVGKGTIAKIIATNNDWKLLDSGSIYRAFAYSIKDVSNPSTEYLEQHARNLHLEFLGDKVLLGGIDINPFIRNEEIGNLASKFAKIETLRAALLERQRAFATSAGLVADGRDMGTVVFPKAKYKVFLTASAEIRANRRVNQLQAINNSSKIDGIYQEVLASIKQRDERDKNRTTSPLMPSADAYIIDTSELSIEQVVEEIINYMLDLR